jgi:hypothetical protein
VVVALQKLFLPPGERQFGCLRWAFASRLVLRRRQLTATSTRSDDADRRIDRNELVQRQEIVTASDWADLD